MKEVTYNWKAIGIKIYYLLTQKQSKYMNSLNWIQSLTNCNLNTIWDINNWDIWI